MRRYIVKRILLMLLLLLGMSFSITKRDKGKYNEIIPK